MTTTPQPPATEKRIGYAYATSEVAKHLDQSATGCYYLALVTGRSETLLTAHQTFADAVNAANRLNAIPFSRWSMTGL